MIDRYHNENCWIRTAHTSDGWTPETIAKRVLKAFEPSYFPLHRSNEVFTWDPV